MHTFYCYLSLCVIDSLKVIMSNLFVGQKLSPHRSHMSEIFKFNLEKFVDWTLPQPTPL